MDGPLFVGITVLIIIAVAVAYFFLAAPRNSAGAASSPSQFHCRFCGAHRAATLLDSSHRFLGEVACLRCGQINRGVIP